MNLAWRWAPAQEALGWSCRLYGGQCLQQTLFGAGDFLFILLESFLDIGTTVHRQAPEQLGQLARQGDISQHSVPPAFDAPVESSQGFVQAAAREQEHEFLPAVARLIFFGGRVPMIDVFYDRLDYNHPIEYKGRLEIHPLCVSMTDLLLQKLQIVQINDTDLKDAILLLLAARIGEADEGMVNAKYVAKLMSEDWGFYYTSTTNLERVRTAVDGVNVLDDAQRVNVREQAALLSKYIEDAPKSMGWKIRSKIGTRKLWYQEVSEKTRQM